MRPSTHVRRDVPLRVQLKAHGRLLAAPDEGELGGSAGLAAAGKGFDAVRVFDAGAERLQGPHGRWNSPLTRFFCCGEREGIAILCNTRLGGRVLKVGRIAAPKHV
jgi:hypothetical protein